MSRSKKLQIHYQEQLKEHKIDNVSIFIQLIINADITKGKYARFLIESFLNDKFLEEDLVGGLESTIGQAISLFDKHKGKLPIEQRSVYALKPETDEMLYQSPGDLWNKVKQYQGELSGKELKKEEQEKIYRETEFVYKDEETGFQIISPLTEESAKWWGKGTRWCTSAENNNMFYDYAKDAPLLILLMSNGDKLQVYNGDQIQFMDEADKTVSLEYIEQHWTIFKPICLWLNDIRFIPDNYKTYKMCKLAVKQNTWALQFISKELITEELYKIALKNNGIILFLIPDHLITKNFCEIAVKNNGFALRYIPEKLRVKKICELAIKNNGLALEYVPKELKTIELCELAVKNNGSALKYVPKEYITKELFTLAVQQNGVALAYVPYKSRNLELCKLAMKNDGYALEYVPEKYKTFNTCKLAVENNGSALECVPEKFKTIEMCKLAAQQNGVALAYVPEELKTIELYKLGIANSTIYLLNKMPKELITFELCKLTIEKKTEHFDFVPKEYKTKELYELINQDINILKNTEQELNKNKIIQRKKYNKTFQKLKKIYSK